jgi:hypothetical protein
MGTPKSIKTKLGNNNAIIAKADTGSSIVILTIQNYDNKINNFITQNHFLTINTDPTSSFQNNISKITNSSKTLILQEHKRKYLDLNPSLPTIKKMCIDCDPASFPFFIYEYLKHDGDVLPKTRRRECNKPVA